MSTSLPRATRNRTFEAPSICGACLIPLDGVHFICRHVLNSFSRSSRHERRLSAEAFVVAVLDPQALALRAAFELQCVVREGHDREPMAAVDRLADGGGAPGQVLGFRG